MKKLPHFPLLLFMECTCVILLLFSCRKDTAGTSVCRLDKAFIYFYDTVKPLHHASYVYKDNLIFQIVFPNFHYQFEYNKNQIRRRIHYSSILRSYYQYEEILYNSDGFISRINTYTNMNGIFKQSQMILLQYFEKRVTKASLYIFTSGKIIPRPQMFEYFYTGANISRVIYTNYLLGGSPLTTTFSFDNRLNIFLKQGPESWLTDCSANSLSLLELPVYWSINNVIKIASDQSIEHIQ